MFRIFIFSVLFIFLPFFAEAADLSSPLGIWQTLNEDTRQPASLVKIDSEHGVLIGRIQALLPGAHFKPGDVCTACPEPFKNQAILGLKFLWGFEKDPDGTWKKGKVLDPLSGHIYQGTIKLADQGQKMELRGYWGPFWRTQTWSRYSPVPG